MQKSRNTQQKDVSMSAIIIVSIAAILIYLLIGPLRGKISLEDIEFLFSRNQIVLSVFLVSAFANMAWYGSTIDRYFKFKKQGKKLAKLINKKEQKIKFYKFAPKAFAIMVILFALSLLTTITKIRWPLSLLEYSFIKKHLQLFLAFNISLLGPMILIYAYKIASAFRSKNLNSEKLKERPTKKNTVYIGTEALKTEDDSLEETSKWIEMNDKALNGGVLITGSIGSGKTVSALIPIVEQIITNFEKFPAILALDPKNTFNKDLIKLLKEKNQIDRLLHLKLGGDVTINPFYKEQILKDGNFIEVANMFRRASDNFMGDKSGSVFWDESAFNLLKNAVIFSGAMYGYITMEHIYNTLLESVDNDSITKMVADLRTISENGKFDAEELFNINSAIRYFTKEFDKLDSKIKTGVLSTATVFLNMFQEYQANKIFCPKKESLTISSFNKLIESGKILIFDIQKEGLAAPMATFIKLMYMQAVLDRTKEKYATDTNKMPHALIVADEYQDVVTATSKGLSDVSVLAKGRSSKLIFLAASQSLSSMSSAIKNEKASKTLFQNFRTKIALHSSDLDTINLIKELVGKEDIKRHSHSISELSQKAQRNIIQGGFDSDESNISESMSTSTHKDYTVTAKDFSTLNTFEALAIVYNGVSSTFKRVCLKPAYLEQTKTPHKKILEGLLLSAMIFVLSSPFTKVMAFPNICTIVNSPQFSSCLAFKKSSCMCKSKWPLPPHPCARITYYVPQTFIEVQRESRNSYFSDLPAAAAQLASVSPDGLSLFNGVDDDNGLYTYQAHSLAVPFSSYFNLLNCGGTRTEKTCFDGMSEHLGMNWKSGQADLKQPAFLAWSAAPKACLIKGAIMSTTGGGEIVSGNEGACSYPMSWLTVYPPSTHSVCNGWGLHFPRTGSYDGVSQIAGALTIAARMKSLSSEVFRATPSSIDEKWQMTYPNSSMCFREGENVGLLEIPKQVNEVSRTWSKKQNGYLFTVWKKVSCCVEYPQVPAVYASLAILKSVCRGANK